MDAKGTYSKLARERHTEAESHDDNLLRAIGRAHERVERHGSNWEWVDLNEVLNELAPGASPIAEGTKLKYYNHDRTICVIVDVSGYLRIMDVAASQSSRRTQYLDIHGKDAHNITVNGKQRGRTKDEFQRATHYRIKKRGMTQ
ncbi:hypothetical protein [Bifidobacterium cuniculi]|uniref:hypothetical protein n=1 Tax=Bifidobacterium cuniculi TaxID=1688 RepID=UPI001269C564|nr:hypothetical protein [Bifidobacterium cuniculi]